MKIIKGVRMDLNNIIQAIQYELAKTEEDINYAVSNYAANSVIRYYDGVKVGLNYSLDIINKHLYK